MLQEESASCQDTQKRWKTKWKISRTTGSVGAATHTHFTLSCMRGTPAYVADPASG